MLLESSIVSWCTMVREMRDDAGLQVVYDGAGLELTDQQPGLELKSMSNRLGTYSELPAGPDAAYDHPEHLKSDAAYGHPQYLKPDADHGGAYVGVNTPAVRSKLTPRRKWMIGAVVLLLVVIIAVLGGVLGSRSRSAPSATPPLNASSIINNTGLAALAWQDTDNVLQYRVYYQTANNEIRESAWNNSQSTWYTLNDRIGLAKNGSSLAAAVKGNSVVSIGQGTNITDLSILRESFQG